MIQKSKNEGPDFVIDKIAHIECVAPEKGDQVKPDTVFKIVVVGTSKELRAQDVPFDKMIFRITNVIKEKTSDKYKNWKNKKWFDSKMPFAIAVNTGDLSWIEDPNIPNILKALFGFQFLKINKKTGRIGFSYRDEIYKLNGSPVPTKYFINTDYSFVSGILFSHELVLNTFENIGEDCIFVNNPFSDNPVNELFVKSFKNRIAVYEEKSKQIILNSPKY